MESRNLAIRAIGDEEILDEVAAKIRPLPETVVPSDRFREQMRLRLLRLDPAAKDTGSQRAA
jgi:hypothetical protein